MWPKTKREASQPQFIKSLANLAAILRTCLCTVPSRHSNSGGAARCVWTHPSNKRPRVGSQRSHAADTTPASLSTHRKHTLQPLTLRLSPPVCCFTCTSCFSQSLKTTSRGVFSSRGVKPLKRSFFNVIFGFLQL